FFPTFGGAIAPFFVWGADLFLMGGNGLHPFFLPSERSTMNESELIPITEAALRLGVSRERAVRLVQRGILEGEFRRGRWFAKATALDLLARRLTESRALAEVRPT